MREGDLSLLGRRSVVPDVDALVERSCGQPQPDADRETKTETERVERQRERERKLIRFETNIETDKRAPLARFL